MADSRIEIDVSAALADIARLKGGMSDAAAAAARAGASITAAFDVDSAHGVADAVNDLQKEYNQLKTSAATLKQALKGATDPTVVKLYARSIAELELGMQRLEKAGKSAGISLKAASKEASTGKQVFEGLFGQFSKVALITGAIAAVAKFTTYAVGLSQQVSSATRTFEAFTGSAQQAGKIVESLIATGQKNFIPTDDILQAGKALLAFGENADNLPDVLTRIANVSAATGKDFNELTTIYGKARTAGVLYAEDINQLVDAGIPIIQEFAKQMGVSNDQVKKLASEGKITFEELQLAMFNLTAEGGKFAGQSQVQAESIGGAWKKLLATVQPVIKAIGDAVSFVVTGALNALNFLAEKVGSLFSDSPAKLEVDYTGRDAYEQAKDDLYERQRLEKEADKARSDRNKKSNSEAAALEKARQKAILDGMKEGIDKEIAEENYRYKTLLKELRRFHLDTTEATEQHNINLTEIQQRETARQLALLDAALEIRKRINEADIKAAEDASKARKASIDERVDDLKALADLKDLEVDITEQAGISIINEMRRRGASESEINEAKRQLDLETQKARLQNELNFQLAFLETIEAGNTKQLDSTLRTIDLLKAKINNLTSAQGSPGKKSLLERLGFDEKSLDQLNEAKNQIIGALQEIAAANVQIADEELQRAEQKTQDAADALQREQDLAEQGFASNVTLRQKELDQAKADEAKALSQKRAAQRQQIALDSALQLSGLITTSVNILKGWSTIPFVGQALGIAAIAAMFGAFAVTKARAFSATKLKHGGQGRVDGDGIIMGASHDSGGVGIEAEGGEFFGTDGKRFGVVNRKMTAKHFDLLRAINMDDRAGMVAAVSRISMNRSAVGAAVGGRDTMVVLNPGDKEAHKLLRDIRDRGSVKKEVTFSDGVRIERRGNHTRRIKAA